MKTNERTADDSPLVSFVIEFALMHLVVLKSMFIHYLKHFAKPTFREQTDK